MELLLGQLVADPSYRKVAQTSSLGPKVVNILAGAALVLSQSASDVLVAEALHSTTVQTIVGAISGKISDQTATTPAETEAPNPGD